MAWSGAMRSPQALKRDIFLNGFTARVNSCPSQTLPELEFSGDAGRGVAPSPHEQRQRQPIMLAPTWLLPRRVFRHNHDPWGAPVASGFG
jgi:hypothetical protein